MNYFDFNSDGTILAASLWDGQTVSVGLFEALNGRLIRKLESPASMKSFRFESDNQFLTAELDDGNICVWSVADGTRLEGQDQSSAFSTSANTKVDKAQTSGSLDDPVSPDGQIIAVRGTDGGSLKLCRASDESLLHSLEDYTTLENDDRSLSRPVFSPYGQVLAAIEYTEGASVSNFHTLKLWGTTDGVLLAERRITESAHPRGGYVLRFSPTATLLALKIFDYRLGDNALRIFRVADGVPLYDLTCDGRTITSTVSSLTFSPDGQLLAASYSRAERRIAIWCMSNWELLQNLEGHTEDVSALAFSPDGTILASASQDGSVKLWHMPDALPLGTLAHHSGVNCIDFSPDGELLVTGCWDSSIRLWRTSDHMLMRKLEDPEKIQESDIRGVAFSRTGKTLFSASRDFVKGVLCLWRVSNGERLNYIIKAGGGGVAVSPNGEFLVTGAKDDEGLSLFRIARTQDGEDIEEVRNKDSTRVAFFGNSAKVTFSSEGGIAATTFHAYNSRGVYLMRILDDDIQILLEIEWEQNNVESLALSPDGRILACGMQTGDIEFRWVASGQLFHTLRMPAPKNSPALTDPPDNNDLRVANNQATVRPGRTEPTDPEQSTAQPTPAEGEGQQSGGGTALGMIAKLRQFFRHGEQ